MPNFVASTTSSRRAAMAGPTSCSLVKGPVDVGGVEERHAMSIGAGDGGERLVVVGVPIELAHAHAAES